LIFSWVMKESVSVSVSVSRIILKKVFSVSDSVSKMIKKEINSHYYMSQFA
jgi:hypothetical protein